MKKLLASAVVGVVLSAFATDAANADIVQLQATTVTYNISIAMENVEPRSRSAVRERNGTGSSAGSGFSRFGATGFPEIVEARYAHREDRLSPSPDTILMRAEAGVSGKVMPSGFRDITATSHTVSSTSFIVTEPVQYELGGRVSVDVSELVGACTPLVYVSANLERWPGGVGIESERLTVLATDSKSLVGSGVLLPGTYYIDLIAYAHASIEGSGASFDFDALAEMSIGFTAIPAPGALALGSVGLVVPARRRR